MQFDPWFIMRNPLRSVYASKKPVSCKIDGEAVEFGYEESMVMVQVPWSAPESLSSIKYLF